MSKTKDVLVVSAMERHNFGDWLLSYMVKQLLPAEYRVRFINVLSVRGIGMSESLQMTNLLALAEEDFEAHVIHAGGHTVGCSTEIAWQISTNSNFDATAQRTFGSDRQLAYVTPSSEKIDGVLRHWPRRYFFGVGGEVSNSNSVHELKNARFLATRDVGTHESLAKLGMENELTPDIVTLLSDVFSPLVSPAANPGITAMVQCSLHAINEVGLAELAAELAGLNRQVDRIVLNIAGFAPYHDSWRSLIELRDRINAQSPGFASCAFAVDPLRIVAHIATADLVIATSLHYRIVSESFGVPCISWGSGKVQQYVESWATTKGGYLTDITTIGDRVSEILTDDLDALQSHSTRLKAIVNTHWAELLNTMELT